MRKIELRPNSFHQFLFSGNFEFFQYGFTKKYFLFLLLKLFLQDKKQKQKKKQKKNIKKIMQPEKARKIYPKKN